MDQPKAERALRLILLLVRNNRYSIDELANRIGTSQRTIYRYIDTIRTVGLDVRSDKEGLYFIPICALPQLYHYLGNRDDFWTQGLLKEHIRLRIDKYAFQLLLEEFPLSENDLDEDGEDHWILDGYIHRYEGVAGFILGMLDDVEILEGEGLKAFVRDRIIKNMERLQGMAG